MKWIWTKEKREKKNKRLFVHFVRAAAIRFRKHIWNFSDRFQCFSKTEASDICILAWRTNPFDASLSLVFDSTSIFYFKLNGANDEKIEWLCARQREREREIEIVMCICRMLWLRIFFSLYNSANNKIVPSVFLSFDFIHVYYMHIIKLQLNWLFSSENWANKTIWTNQIAHARAQQEIGHGKAHQIFANIFL